ncbi:MAG: nickel pincer cofactor biosynthesis protein LarB [Lachnospiraceae bacterium]|nr:nickel pincer cofactor biosynthesis protein LarB [Lachnospiraceae bacterium]
MTGTEEILEKVASGEMSVAEAEKALKSGSYAELGFAKLDTGRSTRSGFPEVVYCEGKQDDHLVSICKRLFEDEGRLFGTRANEHQFELVKNALPSAEYDPVSRIIRAGEPLEKAGTVAICCGGTSDVPVAEEAAQTAEFFGCNVERIYDVGVSGLHRLLSKTETIRKANCVVAIAGMEGALASVVGGLVSVPVIAVPTSVGYGANFEGLSALLSMINSCANGVAVVNIDNGYGAGYLSAQINRLAVQGKK